MWIIIVILLLIIGFILLLKRKNKINKKLIIGIVIVITTIIIVIGVIKLISHTTFITIVTSSISNIKERKYNKISNNLYYTDDLLENKGHDDKEKILNYYTTISNYLNTKYPTLSFYITNFNYDTLNKDKNSMIFNLYQIIDMAIIDKTMFSIGIGNEKVIEYDDSDLGFSDSDNFIFNDLTFTSNISMDYVKTTALDLAQKHANEIFSSHSSSKIIKGECYLNYNEEKNFYYAVVLNNGSYVDIDATTGNVIDTYFFNGIYY